MYICICRGVTDRQVSQAVEAGAQSLAELQKRLPVALCCGRCAEAAKALIDERRLAEDSSGSQRRAA